MSTRREPRERANPFTGMPPAALWSAAALAVSLLIAGLLLGGLFRVRTVHVVGRGLPVSAIVQTSGVTGQNIFTVQSDQVVARLDQLHQIVVRKVDTSFPGEVTIYARPRPAWAAWQDGPALYEVDARGLIIRQVQTTSLPEIVTAPGSAAPDTATIQAVRYGTRALTSAPTGARVTFRLQPGIGLTAVGKAGWTVDIGTGDAQTLANRIATLATLLQTVRQSGHTLKFADLRYRVPYMQYAS